MAVALSAIALMLLGTSVVNADRSGAFTKKASPALVKQVAAGGDAHKHQVLVGFKSVRANSASPAVAVRDLKSKTKADQAGFLRTAKSLRDSGHVGSLHAFWITNAVVISADKAALAELAQLPEVESITANERFEIIKPIVQSARDKATKSPGPKGLVASPEWNITKVRAPEVWSGYGVTGDGATVAVIDTGIDEAHPDLDGKVSSFVRIDALGEASAATPSDSYGHGTHVSGTIAGGSEGGSDIGVAPGAELMGVQALPDGMATIAQLLGSLEYVADPNGDSNPSDAPDIANMSWGLPQTSIFLEPIDNLRAAGVLPVVAIGNSGPGSTGSPGDVPSAFAVGATDLDDESASFSSGGEVEWGDWPYIGIWIKPDVSAPGVEVRSAYPGGFYLSASGTSMASPHVAGVAALLVSSNPSLSIDRITSLISSTSRDLGPQSKDTRFGNGRVDAYQAVTRAAAYAAVSGLVHGTGMVDLNAKVDAISSPGGVVQASTVSGGNGEYRLSIAPGTYKMRAFAYGYRSVTSDAFTVAAGGGSTFSPVLATATKNKLTGRVLYGTKVLKDADVVVLSPSGITGDVVNGGFTFRLPEGRYVLRASAPGYRSADVTVDMGATAKVNDIHLAKVKPNLLVVDWGAVAYEEEFTDALDAQGYSYDVLRLDIWDYFMNGEAVSTSQLLDYKNVIWAAGDGMVTGAMLGWDWETGEEFPSPLSTYLDSGGRLLLSGQDALYFMRWSDSRAFVRDYLRVDYVKDRAISSTVRGRNGGVWSGLDMNLLRSAGEDGAGNQLWPDVMMPTDLGVFREAFYLRDSSGVAAIRNNPNDDARLFFAGFGIEGLDNDFERQMTIKKALDAFDAPSGTLSVSSPFVVVHDGKTLTLRGRLSPKVAGERIRLEELTGIRIAGEPDFSEEEDEESGDFEDDEFSLGLKTRPPLTPEQKAERRAKAVKADRDAKKRLANVIKRAGSPKAVRAAIRKMEADPEFVLTYDKIAVTTTRTGGKWSAKMRPESTGLFRVVWEGSATRSFTPSQFVFVAVDPLVKIWKHKTGVVKAGDTVKVRGYVHPEPLTPTRVSLYSRIKGSTKWKLVERVRTGSRGRFSAKYKPVHHSYLKATVGGFQYWEGTSAQTPVKAAHTTSIWSETKLAPRGVRVWISGRSVTAKKGARVQLQVKGSNGWRTVGVDIVSGNKGAWSIPYGSGRRDARSLRAVLGADSTNAAGKSKVLSVRFY